MIGKFKEIRYDLRRWAPEMNEPEWQKFIAKTEEERDELNGKMYDLKAEGWKLFKEQIMDCACGEELQIDPKEFTSTCDVCGADYNGNGDRLADRSQWGEETGEHWSECY